MDATRRSMVTASGAQMEPTISSLQTRFCISRFPSLTQIAGRSPTLSQLQRQSNVGCCLTSGLRVQPFQLAAGLGEIRKKTPHLFERAVLSDARVRDQVCVFRGPTAAPPLGMNDATSCKQSLPNATNTAGGRGTLTYPPCSRHRQTLSIFPRPPISRRRCRCFQHAVLWFIDPPVGQ
jgi:hypothetical protein